MEQDKFKKAYSYASSNPNSEFAIEFKKRTKQGEFNSALKSLGVDTSEYKKAEPKDNSFTGKLKRFGSSLIKSEKGFGESLAGAVQTQAGKPVFGSQGINPLSALANVTGTTKVQNQLNQAQQTKQDSIGQLITRIQEKRTSGEDTTRLMKVLQDLSGTENIDESTFNLLKDKTAKQVIGEGVGVAADVIGAGTLATKVPGIVTKPTSLISGAVQGAKTGAVTGGSFGAVSGGARAAQDGESVTGGAVSGGIGGALLGGALGGVVGGVSGRVRGSQQIKAQKEQLIANNPDSKVAKYTLDGKGRLTNDKVAQEVIKQGVDEGTVATIKGSSVADKKAANKMLDILEKRQTDKKFAALNRSSDVVGENTVKRFNAVNKINKQAGSQLDEVAKGLKGQTVSPEPAIRAFIDDLSGIGVRFKNGQPVFTGSQIEDIVPAENLIKKVVKRMRGVSDDAFELHNLKKFIDEQVSWGKTGEGLSGKTESVLKGLRANVDSLLDNNFPAYNDVNTRYSVTRGALDDFLSSAGSKFDVNKPGAEKQVGTLLRRILSNAQSRVQVTNSVQQLQDVAESFGQNFDDDIITQLVFVDEIERLFGTQAPTSLQGGIQKGVQQAKGVTRAMRSAEGFFDLALKAGASGIDKARGINQEGLIKSLREILR